MTKSPFALTQQQLRDVEQGHREMMRLSDGEPIRLALQPGATRQINGTTYVLNRNHRWTLPQQGSQQQPQRSFRQSRPSPGPQMRQQPGLRQQQPTRQPAPAGIPGAKPSRKPVALDKPDSRLSARKPTTTKTAKPGKSQFFANWSVDEDKNGDGVTDAARVGVPAFMVPPPPRKIPRIPGLQGKQLEAETAFADAFEADPEKMVGDYLKLVANEAMASGRTITFETDGAKRFSTDWVGGDLDSDLNQRSQNRATLNTALHQTANAVTKRAFVNYLDTLSEGDEIMVTVGGCGAGKGYAINGKDETTGQPFVPQAVDIAKRCKVVWDSAGDQNATENPWILHEAEKRGLKVNYLFVHADPISQWAHPERGVVQRANNPKDGRMVDAKVFADSYAIGAKNHKAFSDANRHHPNANFLFLVNGSPPKLVPQMPPEALAHDRRALAQYATQVVQSNPNIPSHIREGALQGGKLWKD